MADPSQDVALSRDDAYPMFLVRRLQAACDCDECDVCAAAKLIISLLDAYDALSASAQQLHEASRAFLSAWDSYEYNRKDHSYDAAVERASRRKSMELKAEQLRAALSSPSPTKEQEK